jgi:hypothetical protein
MSDTALTKRDKQIITEDLHELNSEFNCTCEQECFMCKLHSMHVSDFPLT